MNKLIRYTYIIIMIAAFAYLAWYLFSGKTSTNTKELPVVPESIKRHGIPQDFGHKVHNLDTKENVNKYHGECLVTHWHDMVLPDNHCVEHINHLTEDGLFWVDHL